MAKTRSGRTILETGKPEPLPPEEVPNKMLMDVLLAAGLTHVEIDFDGGGDDGQVATPVGFNGNVAKEIPDALLSKVKDIGYLILERFCPGDWVNNEGGYGTITLHLGETGTATLDFSQRISTTEDSTTEIDVDDMETVIDELGRRT